MRIIAWSSLQYLLDVTSKSMVDFVNPDKLGEGRAHLELLELIINDLSFKIDADIEQIEKYSENPYVKKLKKDNKIQPAKEEFTQLRTNSSLFFKKKRDIENMNVSLLLLGNNSRMMIDKYQKESGLICLSPEKDHNVLFEEDIEDFKLGKDKGWSFARRFLEPHHSVVIADPYLFDEKTQSSIRNPLTEIIPSNLKNTYAITFVGKSEEKVKNIGSEAIIKDRINETKKMVRSKLPDSTIEFHFYNGEDFHDRYLITNNTCIFSGYGFDLINKNASVKKETTWLAFKVFKRISANGVRGVLVYKIMCSKLKVINQWIKKSNSPTTDNPLFRLPDM